MSKQGKSHLISGRAGGAILVVGLVVSIALAVNVGEAFGQTVFRVMDEHGNVTFTDNPDRGGEALQLAPLPSLPPALNAALDRVQTADAAAERRPRGRPGQPFMPYDHFNIVLPRQGAQVAEGMTPVELLISPPLREDHQVRLLINGEVSQTALHSDVFWVTGLPTGRHELHAELLDSSQRLQHRTVPVAISVP